jgi:hypothetical protein
MLVTLDIDDDEVSLFIKLAKSLPFVNEITSAENGAEEIPEWHIPVIKDRFKNIENKKFTDTADFISTLKYKL